MITLPDIPSKVLAKKLEELIEDDLRDQRDFNEV